MAVLWENTSFSFSFIVNLLSYYLMRNLIMSVIFLGIAGYFGSMLYERAILGDGQLEPAVAEAGEALSYSYPARVELKSADGRAMMVTLLGRSTTHIQFKREDGQEFVYQIDSLDANAQDLVLQYPNVGIKDAAAHMAKGSMEVGDLHVQQLEQNIRQIDDEIEGLSREYEGSVSKTDRRTIQRTVEGLQAEKVELQREISDRQ
jgi:hypothetical protein